MSLPRRLVLGCPLCGEFIEASVFAVEVSSAQREDDDSKGLGVTLSAFGSHDCTLEGSRPKKQAEGAAPETEEAETDGE